jgi:hypothetical protein
MASASDLDATARLRGTLEMAPYVVNVLQGSILALDGVDSEPYSQPGDDYLLRGKDVDTRSTVLSRLIERGEVRGSKVHLVLLNARKDESVVTLASAITFFNTYERSGVLIEKVSTNGNGRGFYKVEALKKIVAGLGIRPSTKKPAKGDYVDAIRRFHSDNLKAIEEDRQARRDNVTIEEEEGLELSPSLPGGGRVEIVEVSRPEDEGIVLVDFEPEE